MYDYLFEYLYHTVHRKLSTAIPASILLSIKFIQTRPTTLSDQAS